VRPDPATVGARVLAALDRARERAIAAARERAADNERLVRRELDIDLLDGHHERGRARRIHRRLRRYGVEISERNVYKVLARLSSGSHDPGQTETEDSENWSFV
jgi:hypothetical protein